MDRGGRRTAALGLAIALGGAAWAAPGAPPVLAARWLSPDADRVALLARAPAECLRLPPGREARLSVELGRAAFRTPLLLGGQAARAGLSCEACHRSGRGNPHFLFPGVSGPPGTADVTSSLFSSHRGDGRDDPAPIPDLSGPKAALRIDQAPGARALEPFIHGLIVEEFDGPEPPRAVLEGLAAYVRALSPAACPATGTEAVAPAILMEDARRAVRAAGALAARGDAPSAILALAGARARLSLIDERYAGPALEVPRERLRAADARLAEAQQALRAPRGDARRKMKAWLAASPALEAELRRTQPLSLFDEARLRRAF